MNDPNQSPPPAGGQAVPPDPAPASQPFLQSNGSIHLFRFAGIDVWLHLLWFLVLGYFIYTGRNDYHSPVWAGIECLGLFGIVLLHEFGHAFACRSTGGKADRILLWPLGGVAYVQPPVRPGAFLWSIAAGPLVNVALIPFFWGFSHWGRAQPWAPQAPDLLRCVFSLQRINLGLLMFNMLPIYPLDGGQIVQSLLWFVIGRAYSLLLVSMIGFAAGASAIAAALMGTGDSRSPGILIPYTPLYIDRNWCFLLAFFMISRSVRAFTYAQSLVRLSRMRRIPGQQCPSCRERPLADPLWMCDQCGAHYNPFDTGNTCPQCGKTHDKIQCPFCREWSEPLQWRRPTGN